MNTPTGKPTNAPDFAFAALMNEDVRSIVNARLAEAERKIERLLAQGEQVHTLRHYSDGRMTAIVSPVGRLFTDAIEVNVQGPILSDRWVNLP